MSRIATSILAFASLATFACGAPAGDEETEELGDEIVGVTDLKALETELGFVIDQKGADGRYRRPGTTVRGGPCYKSTVGSAQGASFSFRRYRTGAAFFRKQGTAPGTGEKRPVVCVDVDVKEDGVSHTYALKGTALDALVRLRLGKLVGRDAATGQYYQFANATLTMLDAEQYCADPGGADETNPMFAAANSALRTCRFVGKSEEECLAKAVAACSTAVAAQLAADKIDYPKYDNRIVDDLKLTKDGSHVPVDMLALAHRYADRAASRADIFSMGDDPVGRFVGFEPESAPYGASHMRFQHLDVHRLYRPGLAKGSLIEQLALTPKLADDYAAKAAIVLCERTGSANFTCKGTVPIQ